MKRTRGLETVLANLDREISKIKKGSLNGLVRAGLHVLRDVELTVPLTPVDLGNLRASRTLVTSQGGIGRGRNPAFVGKDAGSLGGDHQAYIAGAIEVAKRTKPIAVAFGFSAKYASDVHEMTDDVRWTREGSGAKYFEKAIDRNVDNILNLIKKEVKIR
jgi:hypothetical protein